MTKKLFTLMNEKQTNLALSADVTEATQLLDLADQLGPEICVLKTHIDTINDFTPALTQELKKLAKKHGFFLFEDRKFADIGHTAQNQYQGGVFEIAEWADIITAHALPGPGLIQGLAEIGLSKERGVLLLASMSSRPNFFNDDYAQQTLQLAEAFPNFVMGFISQHRLSDDPRWIYLTPGVKLSPGTDHLGQGYITPEKAIVEQGTDIIIVGRGIIQAEDPLVEAQQYRARAWQAYLQRG
jgi:uridine monophosphate synthetase